MKLASQIVRFSVLMLFVLVCSCSKMEVENLRENYGDTYAGKFEQYRKDGSLQLTGTLNFSMRHTEDVIVGTFSITGFHNGALPSGGDGGTFIVKGQLEDNTFSGVMDSMTNRDLPDSERVLIDFFPEKQEAQIRGEKVVALTKVVTEG